MCYKRVLCLKKLELLLVLLSLLISSSSIMTNNINISEAPHFTPLKQHLLFHYHNFTVSLHLDS